MGRGKYWDARPRQPGATLALQWGQLPAPAMPRPPWLERHWEGADACGYFPGKGRREEGRRERCQQLATAVFKTSSKLLGGIKGKKNKTPNKTKQENRETALREVLGSLLSVLPRSEAWFWTKKEGNKPEPSASSRLMAFALGTSAHTVVSRPCSSSAQEKDDAITPILQMGKLRLRKSSRQVLPGHSPQ